MSASSFPTPTSPLYELAIDYVRASGNHDYGRLEALFADDFTHQLHPASIRTHGLHQRINKDQFIARHRQMMDGGAIIRDFGIDLHHPVNVVEAKDCIVLQLASHGVLASGKPFPQEYLHIIRFRPDQKIVSIDSWNDSALLHATFPGASFPKYGEDGLVTNLKEVVMQAETNE